MESLRKKMENMGKAKHFWGTKTKKNFPYFAFLEILHVIQKDIFRRRFSLEVLPQQGQWIQKQEGSGSEAKA